MGLLPDVGQEGLKFGVPGTRHPGQDVLEVRPRLDLVQPGGADDAEEGRGGLAAVLAPSEEPVLPADRNAAQRPFAAVVVDLKATVLCESAQGRFQLDRVHHRLADRALRKDLRRPCTKLTEDRVQDRNRTLGPHRQTVVR